MIIKILKVPDIPLFDGVKSQLNEMVGLRLQSSSPNWQSSIETSSRAITEDSASESVFIWPNNLLDSAKEKSVPLHAVLSSLVRDKNLTDKRSERYFVFDSSEVKTI